MEEVSHHHANGKFNVISYYSLLLTWQFTRLISDTIRDDHVPSVPIALHRVQLSARFYDLDRLAWCPIPRVVLGFLQDEVHKRHEENLDEENAKRYIRRSLHASFG